MRFIYALMTLYTAIYITTMLFMPTITMAHIFIGTMMCMTLGLSVIYDIAKTLSPKELTFFCWFYIIASIFQIVLLWLT